MNNHITNALPIMVNNYSKMFGVSVCLPPVTWPPCATNADTSGQVEVGSYADT